MYLTVNCPFTLLPASSSGGDTTAMPNLPGQTVIRPPPTPLLPGNPVAYSQPPVLSYNPAVAMIAMVCMADSGDTTFFLVTGLTPPLASVAAITARSFAFTLIAHCFV